MIQFKVQPHPAVQIRDDSLYDLPLGFFDLIVIVEPNPETWMVSPEDEAEHTRFAQVMLDSIDLEYQALLGILNEESLQAFNPDIALNPEMKIIRLMNMSENIDFFECDTTRYADATFFYEVGETLIPEFFSLFFTALKPCYPAWRVAVFGAIFEDEVMRTANAIQAAGFDTTILTRYSMSERGFVRLEEEAGS